MRKKSARNSSAEMFFASVWYDKKNRRCKKIIREVVIFLIAFFVSWFFTPVWIVYFIYLLRKCIKRWIIGLDNSSIEADSAPHSETPLIQDRELPEKFLFKDGAGNWCESGCCFRDWSGNIVEWGYPFRDYRGNLIVWGSAFYDNRDNLVTWGSPFYDCGDNLIFPK